jgi:uncharacterized protein (TIGR02145 family)
MKTKTTMVAMVTLLIGSLIFWACQEDEIVYLETDTTDHIQLKTEQVEPDCNTHCINPDEEVYFEKTDQQIISWAGPDDDKFSKSIDIVYYNTLTHFVLKVKSTSGIADILVDGESVKDFDGTIAENAWHEIAFPLAEDWQACDSWGFELQITGYGLPAYFAVEYQLIGECADETVTDIDGNVYRTVQIGNQMWMAENLRATKYNNGDEIPTDLDNNNWSTTTSGAYVIYDLNHWSADGINSLEEMVEAYGKLYNWYAVDDSRGLCPEGWHVPTDEEWTILVDFLGGSSVAGGKMKSTHTEPEPHPRWRSPNTGATNESGFSGLPGGYRDGLGYYGGIGGVGYLWSYPEYPTASAWSRILSYGTSSLSRYDYYSKRFGFSVRCIKNVD